MRPDRAALGSPVAAAGNLPIRSLLGVVLYPAKHYAFDARARPFLRLGLALDESEMSKAIRVVTRTLRV